MQLISSMKDMLKSVYLFNMMEAMTLFGLKCLGTEF